MQTPAQKIAELAEAFEFLNPNEQEEVKKILKEELPLWIPISDTPQEHAYNSQADVLYFGGSAGGAKSDLLLGLCLTKHRRSIVFRREATQTVALVDRLAEILGSRSGFNSQQLIWRLPHRQIEFGSCPNPGDELKWQGRPHDLIGFDEIPLFTEQQFRFLTTWLRTTIPGQRCRIVCTGNPPTKSEGRWVIDYWGPWLNDKHPNPAKSGELRWFTTLDGKDAEVESGEPFKHKGQLIKPRSRTFIPSSVEDNPFLLATDYKGTLQALPEPLRSQMLLGDFRAGIEDSQWQLIPTAWVDEAQARWKPDGKRGFMDSMGVDPAMGGNDKFAIATRYGNWYSQVITYPGTAVPDGSTGAGYVVAALRDNAPVHVDIIGTAGGALVTALKSIYRDFHVVSVNGSESAPEGATDRASHKLAFRNMRAYIWWRFRESLDPISGDKIALPPDPEIKADLCAPLWMITPGGILVEPKEDKMGANGMIEAGLKRRLGRSPDKGEAVVYASIVTPRRVRREELPPQPNIARSYVPQSTFKRKG